MLRASQIPPLLSRILGDGIDGAMLLTSDGELLGSAFANTSNPMKANRKNSNPNTSSTNHNINLDYSSAPTSMGSILGKTLQDSLESELGDNRDSHYDPLDAASIGALVAEVAGDYARAGRELLSQGRANDKGSELECLIIETENGRLVGVACCSFFTSNNFNSNQLYYVAATGISSHVGYGLLRARIMALEGYVRESLVQVSVYGNSSSATASNEAVVS